MFRLGVAVRILGKAGLRARDGRRAEHAPHLSVSLLLVREVLAYLAEQQIGCYRLADDLAPYLTDARHPAFARQIDECGDLLAETGALAREHGIRLSMHMPMHVALAAPDAALAERSASEVIARARLLDALGAGPEAVLVLHVGGAHGDGAAARFRFAACYERLPEPARRRVVVEPDESSFDLPDLLRLHQVTGAPVVLDILHHQINDRSRIPLGQALGLALATWPRGMRPKIHFSTQRTEAHLLPDRRGQARRVLAPQAGQHADYINPFEFAALIAAARGLPPFDIMLEAKAADLALLRLREDLRRYAPEAASQVW
jgi:UV DNA damage endonuclease